jgi:hypothetical protein
MLVDIPGDPTTESVVSALGGSLAPGGGALTGIAAAAAVAAARDRSAHLMALHRQRMLLAGLRDEAECALRTFSGANDPGWVSGAQRQYAVRRAELRHELMFAARALDEALAGVVDAIARVEGAG